MLNHGDDRLGSLLLDAKMDKGFPRVARVGKPTVVFTYGSRSVETVAQTFRSASLSVNKEKTAAQPLRSGFREAT